MQKTSAQQNADRYELTACDREPVHLLGKVQSFGCLIAVSSDWLIMHASFNTGQILNLEAESIVGTRFSGHFPERAAHALRGKTQAIDAPDSVVRVFAFDLFEDGRQFDISVHQTQRGFTYEFERKTEEPDRDDLALVQPLISRVRSQSDLAGLTADGARAVRALSGFDRVMVYQFARDGTGTVIAEACDHEMERFLGLRFPASDVPKQARELFRRSPLRLNVDVGGEDFPIVPLESPEGEPLDLSLAVTRAHSKVHLEYLRNMGVAASLTLSIYRRGELWGLFACHHRTPLYVDYEKRTALELFAQLFTYELAEKLHSIEQSEAVEARILHDRVMNRFSSGNSLHSDFDTLADEIWDVINFDGIALFSEGRYRALGAAPTEEEFLPLVRHLNTTAEGAVFATDHLAARYERAGEFADRIAGLMALPISRQPRDYIVLFRREIAQIVKWAGQPAKPATGEAGEVRLSPRKSFEAWREIVEGKCAEWTQGEIEAANALRATLIEVVLKIMDLSNKDLARAQEKQELLVAELNHRVRNILNLIRGIISQGRTEADTIGSFTSVLDGRIQSLARAHDQLTSEAWSPASLKSLIGVEIDAYSGAQDERVVLTGEDALLVPEAFSVVALVVHELVANSVKYGALSGPSGRIDIGLSRDPHTGALEIRWRESGGPAVQVPAQQGFGTRIIEHSIPYELKGQTEVRYRMTGVEVDMTIPERYHNPAPVFAASPQPAKPDVKADDTILEGHVLLLEDSLIIAMDAQDKLMELGAETVHTASSVSAALDIIDSVPIRFAALDINLGDETSVRVAHRLKDLRIPFILATGYDTLDDVEETYPSSPVLRKPYLTEGLKCAARDALGL